MQILLSALSHYGYPALFLLLLLGIVGLPVPDETLLTFCGFLIYSGRLKFGPAFLAGFSGSAGGISISYMLGAKFGRAFLTRFGKYIYMTPERLQKTEELFQRFGPALLTIGYFIPGVRHFTAIVAGISGLTKPKFALFAYSGALLWVTTFLSLGYFFGERWQHTSELVHRYTLITTCVSAALLLCFWFLRRRKHE